MTNLIESYKVYDDNGKVCGEVRHSQGWSEVAAPYFEMKDTARCVGNTIAQKHITIPLVGSKIKRKGKAK